MNEDYGAKYDQLTFTDDFIFCKVLENNPDLCKELLEVILGAKIRKVEQISKQKAIKVKMDGKGVRFDVYLEDADNTVFDIEMQTTKKKDLPKRSRYYQGMIDMDLIQKREEYSGLKKSYVIFICTSDPFASNLPIYHFKNICMEDKELLLGDETEKVFVNSKGIRQNISDDMKAFLDFLENKESDSHLTRRLQKEVENAKHQEEWRHEYMFLEELYAEKLEEGRKEGRKEGRIEGRIEGRKEGCIELIKKNYAKGMPVSQIAEFMDLSEAEVEQIIEQ